MANGPLPAPIASPVAVSAPVLSSMAYTETSAEPLLATYKYAPFGSTTAATGVVPVEAKGEPAIGVSAPVEASME